MTRQYRVTVQMNSGISFQDDVSCTLRKFVNSIFKDGDQCAISQYPDKKNEYIVTRCFIDQNLEFRTYMVCQIKIVELI